MVVLFLYRVLYFGYLLAICSVLVTGIDVGWTIHSIHPILDDNHHELVSGLVSLTHTEVVVHTTEYQSRYKVN